MAGDRDICTVITAENFVKHRFTPDVLVDLHLALESLPQEIVFREPRLNLVAGECIMDVSLGATSVASVTANTFTEKLLDCRDERMTTWKIETGERDISSLQAARQG